MSTAVQRLRLCYRLCCGLSEDFWDCSCRFAAHMASKAGHRGSGTGRVVCAFGVVASNILVFPLTTHTDYTMNAVGWGAVGVLCSQ
jgi:hypothetical protein